MIGEVAPRERAERAMSSAHEKLNSEFGLRPAVAALRRRRRARPRHSTFPPGAKENGGIFCHANTWAIVAAAMLG